MTRPSLLHEYGMPSSHSQFMWFFATYMFLFLWVRLRHISNTNTMWIWIWKTAITLGCLVASVVVSVSRFTNFFILFVQLYLIKLVSNQDLSSVSHSISSYNRSSAWFCPRSAVVFICPVHSDTMVSNCCLMVRVCLIYFQAYFSNIILIFINRRISEWFLVRDQTLIPNIIWFEYTSHRHEIRARSRKLVSMKSQ